MIQLLDKINCTDLRLEYHHTSSSKNVLTLQFNECNSIHRICYESIHDIIYHEEKLVSIRNEL